jgi:phospholipase C
MAAAALGAFTANAGAVDPDKSADRVSTATPIKHVIVVLAENSSFDHVFGTFRPRDGQRIANLLSKGIVNADGTPAPISRTPRNSRCRRSRNISSPHPMSARRLTSRCRRPI